MDRGVGNDFGDGLADGGAGRMPELPELETIVRGLRPRLLGRRFIRARLRHRGLYRRGSLRVPWLVGRLIAAVERIGKNALFRLEPSGLVVINLGMTGRLRVCAPGDVPDRRHLHGRFYLDNGDELHFNDPRRFGHVFIAEACDFARDLNIGPDPFDAKARYLRGRLHNRRASIKSLLLDQRILSGIGNIYADELLFYCQIDPRTSGHRVATGAAALLSHTRTVLKRAIRHGGSTLRDYRSADGVEGSFQELHAVYGREGDECIECGVPIRKIVLGGRGTHFCPSCQR